MVATLLQEVFSVRLLIQDKYSSQRVFKYCLNILGPKRWQKKDSGLCGSVPQAVLDWGDICKNLAWSGGNSSKSQAAPLRENKTEQNKTKQNASSLKADYVKEYEKN